MHGPGSTPGVLSGTPTSSLQARDTATPLRGFLPRLLEELQENTSFRNKTLEEEGTRVHTESGCGAHRGKALGPPRGRAQQHPAAGRGRGQGCSRGTRSVPRVPCSRGGRGQGDRNVAGDTGAETARGRQGGRRGRGAAPAPSSSPTLYVEQGARLR